MVKYSDQTNNVIDVMDKWTAEEISTYLINFIGSHRSSMSDFNKNCFEVASRVLWRYNKYGFYKENQQK